MSAPQAPATSIAKVCQPDLEIDITAELCPMTFVRTRLALDRLSAGQVLGVLLQGEEPLGNVPKTARQQGHTVIGITALEHGQALVLIRKKPSVPATPAAS